MKCNDIQALRDQRKGVIIQALCDKKTIGKWIQPPKIKWISKGSRGQGVSKYKPLELKNVLKMY